MSVTSRREMAITHDEFLRIFNRAFAHLIVELETDVIVINLDGERMRIRLLPEKRKKIGVLEWVTTEVELVMGNVPRVSADRFIDAFEQAFQKGGG